jgi:hypothetical protein
MHHCSNEYQQRCDRCVVRAVPAGGDDGGAAVGELSARVCTPGQGRRLGARGVRRRSTVVRSSPGPQGPPLNRWWVGFGWGGDRSWPKDEGGGWDGSWLFSLSSYCCTVGRLAAVLRIEGDREGRPSDGEVAGEASHLGPMGLVMLHALPLLPHLPPIWTHAAPTSSLAVSGDGRARGTASASGQWQTEEWWWSSVRRGGEVKNYECMVLQRVGPPPSSRNQTPRHLACGSDGACFATIHTLCDPTVVIVFADVDILVDDLGLQL